MPIQSAIDLPSRPGRLIRVPPRFRPDHPRGRVVPSRPRRQERVDLSGFTPIVPGSLDRSRPAGPIFTRAIPRSAAIRGRIRPAPVACAPEDEQRPDIWLEPLASRNRL